MQKLGWQTKSILVCYGIFWSGQLERHVLLSRTYRIYIALHPSYEYLIQFIPSNYLARQSK